MWLSCYSLYYCYYNSQVKFLNNRSIKTNTTEKNVVRSRITPHLHHKQKNTNLRARSGSAVFINRIIAGRTALSLMRNTQYNNRRAKGLVSGRLVRAEPSSYPLQPERGASQRTCEMNIYIYMEKQQYP